MTSEIPIEATSFVYVPESLKDIKGAPKFTLRYGTRRDKHYLQQEAARRGLNRSDNDEIRAATLSEMQRNSQNTPEALERMVDCADRYWQAMNELAAAREEWAKDCADLQKDDSKAELPAYPVLIFDKKEEVWIENILNTVASNSELVGNMRAQNAKFEFEMKEIYLSTVLLEVDGFNLVRRHDKLIENQCLIDLEEWLGEQAETLGLDTIAAGWCYSELCNAAQESFWLPKAARKNSLSPPPITSSQTSSTLDIEQTDDTTLKASAKSKASPQNSSAEPISESSTSPSLAETGGATSSGPTVAE